MPALRERRSRAAYTSFLSDFIQRECVIGGTQRRYLCRLCRFVSHSSGTGASWRPTARGAHRSDIHIQLLEVASQGVAMDAQFVRGSDLIPTHVSENRNEEGLLKCPHCLRVCSTAAVHLQNESFKLFFHGRPF
jgi:hypothetical protein